MRVPLTLPKPRLTFTYYDGWRCVGLNAVGYGTTPKVAYTNWRNVLVLRGAEIFRSLKEPKT